MIKIGHFIDSQDPGGAESMVIELCIEQIRRNNKVEVLHFGNRWLEDKCNHSNITHVKVPFHVLYKSVYTLPLFCIIFTFFLVQRRISILHTHLFDTVIPAVPASILARVPHIATLHDIYSIENNRLRHVVIKYASMTGSIIVAVSKKIVDHIGTFGVVGTGRIHLVRNGVNMEKYSPANTCNIDISLLDIDAGDVKIVSVGRLVPIKAYEILLTAFKLLHDKCKNVALFIIGDGPEMDNLVSIANKLNITNKVCFLGQRDDIADILRQADIFALSSLSEGLSCSIIEAMASGLPIIATNVGGNCELVHSKVNGFLVPEGDAQEFSNKLLELVQDKSKRDQFSFMSRTFANDEFSTKAMCDNYDVLYAMALSK